MMYSCPELQPACEWVINNVHEKKYDDVNAVVFHGCDIGNEEFSPQGYAQRYGQKNRGQSYWIIMGESHASCPAQIDPKYRDHIDYCMGLDLDCAVPMTSAHRVVGISYFHLTPKRDDADGIFISSNCNPHNNRIKWMTYLVQSSGLRIHSYGRCLHNQDWPGEDKGQDSKEKYELMGTYKFCFTMDNTDQKDYISEKLFQALAAGCVPVYMGAPNIDDYMPQENAIVNANKFNSPEDLGNHLKELLKDNAKYEEHLKWKNGGQGHEQSLERIRWLLRLSQNTMYCRLCTKVLEHVSMHRPLVNQQGKVQDPTLDDSVNLEAMWKENSNW